MWGAIRVLGVDRIGHGVRAVEDPELVRHLAATRIPLEVCPTSNVRTGVVVAIAQHPIRRLFDAGVLVTVNSDDPAFFGTTLNDEYVQLITRLGFSPAELRQLVVNAIDASWLPPQRKDVLRQDFEADAA